MTFIVKEKAFICCFPVTHVSNRFPILVSSIPMKGDLLLFATSIVKLIAGCSSFNVARKVVAVEISFYRGR